jgi:hypothetical protein
MSIVVVNGQKPTIVVSGQQPNKQPPPGLWKTLGAAAIVSGLVAIPIDIVSHRLMNVGIERQYEKDLKKNGGADIYPGKNHILREQNKHSPGDSQILEDIDKCRV